MDSAVIQLLVLAGIAVFLIMKLRSALHRSGRRFQLHRTDLPGTPDWVLPKSRAVIFVHGCFWHRHATVIGARNPPRDWSLRAVLPMLRPSQLCPSLGKHHRERRRESTFAQSTFA